MEINMANEYGLPDKNFWKETFVYAIQDLAIPAGTGIQYTDNIVKVDSDSTFLMTKRVHVATDSRILMGTRDDNTGRNHQNTPYDLRTASGTPISGITPNGFMPFILSSPITIPPSSTLTFSYSDFSGAPNTLYYALHGLKVKRGESPWDKVKIKRKIGFDYVGNVVVGANQVSTINVNINMDSFFIVNKMMCTRTGAAAVYIRDSGSWGGTDTAWMNAPCHIDTIFGNSQFPNMLPVGKFLNKGSVVSITIQDLTGAPNTVRVTLHGVKIFA